MKPANPFGRPLLFLLSTLLMMAVTLGVTHLVVAAYDRDYLASYPRHLMARGLEVANESHKVQ